MDPLLTDSLLVLAGYGIGWLCARQAQPWWSLPCYWVGDDLVKQAERYERRHDVIPNHERDPFANG